MVIVIWICSAIGVAISKDADAFGYAGWVTLAIGLGWATSRGHI